MKKLKLLLSAGILATGLMSMNALADDISRVVFYNSTCNIDSGNFCTGITFVLYGQKASGGFGECFRDNVSTNNPYTAYTNKDEGCKTIEKIDIIPNHMNKYSADMFKSVTAIIPDLSGAAHCALIAVTYDTKPKPGEVDVVPGTITITKGKWIMLNK